jgi:hypothetical protein
MKAWMLQLGGSLFCNAHFVWFGSKPQNIKEIFKFFPMETNRMLIICHNLVGAKHGIHHKNLKCLLICF